MSNKSILFADLAGFTAMTEVHGDDGAATTALQFYELAAQALHGDARIVKTIGDAVMVAASREADIIATACELQAAVEAEENFPSLRAGLHCGHCTETANDLFGATVNLAARIAAHARTGQILNSEHFVNEAQSQAGLHFEPLSVERFKNVDEPVAVYQVLRERGSAHPEIDPVCRMHVNPRHAVATVVLNAKTIYFCSLGCVERFARDPEHFPT